MIVGVTGSFGSGKTAVAKMFKGLGAYVIDADKVCHSLTAPSSKVYKKIVGCFGKHLLKKNKTIDRKKLAEVVFKNKGKLKLLNSLIHPDAIRTINKIIEAKKGKKVIIVDAALLVESGYYRKMEKLILVRSNIERQIERLAKARGIKRRGILRRLKMQAPLRKTLALADFIIDNSASKRQTLLQVEKIWKQLSEDATYET